MPVRATVNGVVVQSKVNPWQRGGPVLLQKGAYRFPRWLARHLQLNAAHNFKCEISPEAGYMS